MREDERDTEVGRGYAFGQLAKAFMTALTHEDAATRERAEGRVEQWRAVLAGIASGKLRIGSREPVADLPAWVTPEVVRGGFATGAAVASGELSLRGRLNERRARGGRSLPEMFAHSLSEDGLTELDAMLDSGAYAVRVPEEAALLTVAWLVGAGETEAALRLVAEIAPLAGRVRFSPTPAHPATGPAVFRETAGDARGRLEKRKPNARVEAMREALAVWNPFADELLAHWLETVERGRVAARFPDGWTERGAALLARYEALARAHTRCTKHRRPKQNPAILRLSLAEAVAGRPLSARQAGLLQHAVDSMVARRGAPGSPEHSGLRAEQAAVASLPAHHTVARVVAVRLAAVPQERGIEAVDALLAPVTSDEAAGGSVPAGTPVPASIRAVVERTLAGTPETLVERGVVPSAEVLAELVPRIAGTTVAAAYADPRLQRLMGANYEAFRRRRSLLLLDLEHQVRVDELPWVQAVAPFRTRGDATASEARATLVRLAELAIDAFPATILPSPLVTELDALSREAGLKLPLVEELAADIFMGTFSAKFLGAAKLAGRLLQGSLYERYYGIDYAAVLTIDDLRAERRDGPRTSPAFDALCAARAGADAGGGFSVAVNGTVIEQAQILTTHNLAALTGPFGAGEAMDLDWPALARRSFARVEILAERLRANPKPLRTVKDLAYAWRQMVFHLTRSGDAETAAFLDWARDRPFPSALVPALGGLERAAAGATLDSPLLGWTTGQHWLIGAVRASGGRRG